MNSDAQAGAYSTDAQTDAELRHDMMQNAKAARKERARKRALEAEQAKAEAEKAAVAASAAAEERERAEQRALDAEEAVAAEEEMAEEMAAVAADVAAEVDLSAPARLDETSMVHAQLDQTNILGLSAIMPGSPAREAGQQPPPPEQQPPPEPREESDGDLGADLGAKPQSQLVVNIIALKQAMEASDVSLPLSELGRQVRIRLLHLVPAAEGEGEGGDGQREQEVVVEPSRFTAASEAVVARRQSAASVAVSAPDGVGSTRGGLRKLPPVGSGSLLLWHWDQRFKLRMDAEELDAMLSCEEAGQTDEGSGRLVLEVCVFTAGSEQPAHVAGRRLLLPLRALVHGRESTAWHPMPGGNGAPASQLRLSVTVSCAALRRHPTPTSAPQCPSRASHPPHCPAACLATSAATAQMVKANPRSDEAMAMPWAVRHGYLTKKNGEAAVVMRVPAVDAQGRGMGPRDLGVEHYRQFLANEIARDLVVAHHASSTLQQLAGGVPVRGLAGEGATTDADVDGMGVGILLLAGDGALRSINPDDAHLDDLLPSINLQHLHPDVIFAPKADPSNRKERRQYTDAMIDKLNELCSRAIGAVVTSAAERGRGVVIVDTGRKSELVSRLAHHLSLWRFPSLRIVGVTDAQGAGGASENEQKRRARKLARALDPNHSHFVVCERQGAQVGQGSANSLPQESAELCETSATVDTAEQLASAIASCKQDMLRTRRAARRLLARDSSVTEVEPASVLRPAHEVKDAVEDAVEDIMEEVKDGAHELAHKVAGAGRRSTSGKTKVVPAIDGTDGTDGAAKVAKAKGAKGRRSAKRGEQAGVPQDLDVAKVCLVINGGARAKVDVLNAVRCGWDVIVLRGTGGLADWISINWEVNRIKLAQEMRAKADGTDEASGLDAAGAGGGRGSGGDAAKHANGSPSARAQAGSDGNDWGSQGGGDDENDDMAAAFAPRYDPVIDEVVSYGKLTILDMSAQGASEDMERLLAAKLTRVAHSVDRSDAILGHAWSQYARFKATEREERFWSIALGIIISLFSFLAVALSVVKLQVNIDGGDSSWMLLLIAAGPIALATTIAVKNRFYKPVRWMHLHMIRQRILREIFLFRMQTGPYSNPKFANGEMASRIGECEKLLLGTNTIVSHLLMPGPEKAHGADWITATGDRAVAERKSALGLSEEAAAGALTMPLDAEGYVRHRLEERLVAYKREARTSSWLMMVLTWLANIVGGASTLLVLLGQAHWATVTINFQNLIQNFISEQGYEMDLLRANRAIKELSQIRDTWGTLADTDRLAISHRQQLVKNTEAAIEAHTAGWLAAMRTEEGEDDAPAKKREQRKRLVEMKKKMKHMVVHLERRDARAREARMPEAQRVAERMAKLQAEEEAAKARLRLRGVDAESYQPTARPDRDEDEDGPPGMSRVEEVDEEDESDSGPEEPPTAAADAGTWPEGYRVTGPVRPNITVQRREGSRAGARASELQPDYEESTVANDYDGLHEEKEGEEGELFESKEPDAEDDGPEEAGAAGGDVTFAEDELPAAPEITHVHAKPPDIVRALLHWARSVTPHRQGVLRQLPTQMIPEVGGNVEVEFTFNNDRKARALVLPNTVDLRSVPFKTMNRFMLSQLLADMQTRTMTDRRKQKEAQLLWADGDGTAGGDGPAAAGAPVGGSGEKAGAGTYGLAVLVIAGEGKRAATPRDERAPAVAVQPSDSGQPLTMQQKEKERQKERARHHRKTRREARLGQFLCRGVPEALVRLRALQVSSVVIDAGFEEYAVSMVSSALDVWRLNDTTRVVGVLEASVASREELRVLALSGGEGAKASADGQQPMPKPRWDFSRLDQAHTHVVAMRQRAGQNHVSLSDPGLRSFSAKVDCAEKLAHCFQEELLLRPPGNVNEGGVAVVPGVTVTESSLYCPPSKGGASGSSNVRNAAVLHAMDVAQPAASFMVAQLNDARERRRKAAMRKVAAVGTQQRAPSGGGADGATPASLWANLDAGMQVQQEMPDELLSLVLAPLSCSDKAAHPASDASSEREEGTAVEAGGTSAEEEGRCDEAQDHGVRLQDARVAMLLVGGGESARVDVVQAVRKGWSIVVIKGSGGFADVVEQGLRTMKNGGGTLPDSAAASPPAPPLPEGAAADSTAAGAVALASKEDAPRQRDVVLAEICQTGKLAVLDVEKDSVSDVASVICSALRPQAPQMDGDGDDGNEDDGGKPSGGKLSGGKKRGGKASPDAVILTRAWRLVAEYQATARGLRRTFTTLEAIVMALAFLTTVFVAVDSELRFNSDRYSLSQRTSYTNSGAKAVTFFIGLSPVLISVVLSVKNRFNFLGKTVALREASALIRREIYHYRTGTAAYYHARFRQPRLANALKVITSRLLQTEAATVSVTPIRGFDLSKASTKDMLALADGDDALTSMHINDYTEHRLQFQRLKFRDQGKDHSFKLKWFECKFEDRSRSLARSLASRWTTALPGPAPPLTRTRTPHSCPLADAGFLFNGLATAIILVKEEVWVASLIVLLGVTSTIVAVGQYEARLLLTNSAIVTLDATLCEWNTLESGDKIKQGLLDKCVARAENAMLALALGGVGSTIDNEDETEN